MAETKTKTKNIKEITPVDPLEDKVELKLLAPSEDKDGASEYLSCNGYNAKAKYGDTIKVPRFIAAGLENCQMAKNELKKNLAKAIKK